MKRWLIILMLLGIMTLYGCEHEHNWSEADCKNPATCADCDETKGKALGHKWSDATCTAASKCETCGEIKGDPMGHNWEVATCTAAQTCSICGEQKGEPAGHEWVAATCVDAEICVGCNKTKGEALGHNWQDATCKAPKTCLVCQATEGEPLAHAVENWSMTKEATCTEEGMQSAVCTACGETMKKTVDKTEHTAGEWVVTKEATATTAGVRIKSCTACGKEMEREEFTKSPEEIEKEYKAACKSYTYSEIARNPGEYKGEQAKFTGKVIQVMQSSYGNKISYTLRIGIKNGYSYYKDIIYVIYTASESDARILEDDMVTMYGKLNGEKTYETTMGASVTIPYFIAEYIDIK